MKKIVFSLALLSIIGMGCQKKSNPEPQVEMGSLELYFQSKVGTTAINAADTYTNAAGNSYKISKFKYFVSNIRLVREDGSEYADKGIYLVDGLANSTQTAKTQHGGTGALVALSVPVATYKGIKYQIAVPSEQNNADASKISASANPLHPDNGMWWSWNSGYKFLNLELNYLPSVGAAVAIPFHIGTVSGTDRSMNFGFFSITSNAQSFEVDKVEEAQLSFAIDINKFFVNADGSNFDFSNPANQMVMGGSSATLIKQNVERAITKN